MKMTMIPLRLILTAASLMLLVPETSMATSSAAQKCYSNWSEAGAIVRKNDLTPANRLKALARKHARGRLIKIALCEDKGGRFIYRLVLFETSGKLYNLTVDADRPFE